MVPKHNLKAADQKPFLQETLHPFSATGFMASFDVGDDDAVTVLAARHQHDQNYRPRRDPPPRQCDLRAMPRYDAPSPCAVTTLA